MRWYAGGGIAAQCVEPAAAGNPLHDDERDGWTQTGANDLHAVGVADLKKKASDAA